MPRSRTTATPDWVEALDFKAALQNCLTDIVGDWYRDPWGWPELRWLVRRKPEVITSRLNSDGVRRAAKIDVAKENFATRPAIVMDPVDRLIYQALVDRISVDLIGDLDDWVYGWRLHPGDPKRGEYSRNDLQYTGFRDHLTSLADVYTAALKTDIVSCFASMPIDRLAEAIEQRAGSSALTNRVVGLIRGWDAIPGRKGLAQRSSASAVIANMYLVGVDDVVRPYNNRGGRWRTGGSARVARWMDDVWLFGNDLGQLRKVQFDLQNAMRDLDLDMNLAKTDVLEGEEVDEQVRQLQHSAVDSGLKQDPVEVGPLDELVDRVLRDPELADRTTLKFLGTRMRTHEVFGRAQDLADVARRMPQGADALARLFRDSELWKDLKTWYVKDYARSPWAVLEWGVAQMGTMFPSSGKGPRPVRDFLAEALATGNVSLTLAALAAQRLAAWNKDLARQVIREAVSKADHPLLRRILGLALVNVGGERANVRRLLGEFEENAVTLAMLEDSNFRRLKIVTDFEGS